MTTKEEIEKLEAFGRDLLEVCKKHKASIDDSTVCFHQKDSETYTIVCFGCWPIRDPSEELKIYKNTEEQLI